MATEAQSEWPTEWLRGVLELCVLAVVSHGPTYGYAIAADLESAGLGAVKGGTLYPLLGRLEAAGLVDVEWRPGDSGPGRKYYALTPGGREALGRRSAAWAEFHEVTARIVARGHGRERSRIKLTDVVPKEARHDREQEVAPAGLPPRGSGLG